jgi:hypothetical protein
MSAGSPEVFALRPITENETLSRIFVLSTALVAIFAVVTFASAIFAVVTFASAIFAVVTALLAIVVAALTLADPLKAPVVPVTSPVNAIVRPVAKVVAVVAFPARLPEMPPLAVRSPVNVVAKLTVKFPPTVAFPHERLVDVPIAPEVLITVEPPIVPSVMAPPPTLPGVVILASFESTIAAELETWALAIAPAGIKFSVVSCKTLDPRRMTTTSPLAGVPPEVLAVNTLSTNWLTVARRVSPLFSTIKLSVPATEEAASKPPIFLLDV